MNNQIPVPSPSSSHLDRLAQQSNITQKNPEKQPEMEAEMEAVVLVFDLSSPAYIQGLDDYNLKFVQEASKVLNHVLQQRGNLFLNDVNDYLKLKRTPEGQLLGWIATDDSPGRINIDVEKNGSVFLLTPNIQGLIQPFI